MQQRLIPKTKIKYSYGSYNKIKGSKQWIRLSQGCPHNCPWCYEPQDYEVYDVPEIKKNVVGIIDMNLLCKPEALEIIKSLPVDNGKKIEYEFVCGIDYRFLTLEIAKELRKHHFKRLRIAWDWFYKDQLKVKDGLKILYRVGYKPEELMIFMICNHPSIKFEECVAKLDLCKIWNVKVADCYYDNQIKVFDSFIPIGWTTSEAQMFRRMVRRHNRLVNWKIDPSILGK